MTKATIEESSEDDIQQVVDLIENNDGKINQKVISNEMDWSDAKTSRLTSELVDAGRVEKRREQRQNYLILKEDSDEPSLSPVSTAWMITYITLFPSLISLIALFLFEIAIALIVFAIMVYIHWYSYNVMVRPHI